MIEKTYVVLVYQCENDECNYARDQYHIPLVARPLTPACVGCRATPNCIGIDIVGAPLSRYARDILDNMPTTLGGVSQP